LYGETVNVNRYFLQRIKSEATIEKRKGLAEPIAKKSVSNADDKYKMMFNKHHFIQILRYFKYL